MFIEAATISLGGKVPLGQFGQLHPGLARQFDLRDPVFLGELNADELIGRRIAARTLKSLPAYPGVRRDIALVVPETVSHAAVLAAVRQAKAANLESVELFDVFRGQSIPEGQKSIAYAFTYRRTDRTLTDAEVNTAHDKLATHLQQTLGATQRAGVH
jgi:phenylalanyl-tRNA synthetase beta chain